MTQAEIIWIASVSAAKKMDYETLKYSDYLYGKETFAEQVWQYVEEYENIGKIAFYEKYKEFKLY